MACIGESEVLETVFAGDEGGEELAKLATKVLDSEGLIAGDEVDSDIGEVGNVGGLGGE